MSEVEQKDGWRKRHLTIWECDCGAINRASFPGMQHPCPMCNHPATIDPVEVVPVQDVREKLEAEAQRLDDEAAEVSENPTIASVKRIQAETIRKAFAAAFPESSTGEAK